MDENKKILRSKLKESKGQDFQFATEGRKNQRVAKRDYLDKENVLSRKKPLDESTTTKKETKCDWKKQPKIIPGMTKKYLQQVDQLQERKKMQHNQKQLEKMEQDEK